MPIFEVKEPRIGTPPRFFKIEPDSGAGGTKVVVSVLINYGHGAATSTPTNVYLLPLLLVNLNVNFPVEGSRVPEKVPASGLFAPIVS